MLIYLSHSLKSDMQCVIYVYPRQKCSLKLKTDRFHCSTNSTVQHALFHCHSNKQSTPVTSRYIISNKMQKSAFNVFFNQSETKLTFHNDSSEAHICLAYQKIHQKVLRTCHLPSVTANIQTLSYITWSHLDQVSVGSYMKINVFVLRHVYLQFLSL